MQINFDARNVQPQQPMEPVPEGWYPVILKSLEPKPVKDKPQCYYLAGEMEIIDGPGRGRKLFINLNTGNDNPQAVDIAYRELSSICHVTGRYVVGDTNELLNLPFQVKAIVEGSRNVIKGYKDMAGNDPGKAGAPAAVAQPTAMPPAAAPAAPQNSGWGAPPAAPAYAAPAAPAAAPAWGQPPAAAPAYAPAAAPAWGGGAPAPAAAPAAPAAPAAWAPAGGAAPGAAPWGR